VQKLTAGIVDFRDGRMAATIASKCGGAAGMGRSTFGMGAGQYVTANFSMAGDGHGGTLITDPPVVSASSGTAGDGRSGTLTTNPSASSDSPGDISMAAMAAEGRCSRILRSPPRNKISGSLSLPLLFLPSDRFGHRGNR
jgi:hypothetical protein